MRRELRVRPAVAGDIADIVALSRRVQAWLDAAGSCQQFGPLAQAEVAGRVRAGTACVLTADAEPARPGHAAPGDERPAYGLRGGAYVEPAMVETLPALAAWGLGADLSPVWRVHKVMVDPDHRGQDLGLVLLDGVGRYAASRGARTLVLDCWAGNEKLRRFYARAGFALRGVFPKEDYEIAVFTRRLPLFQTFETARPGLPPHVDSGHSQMAAARGQRPPLSPRHA